MSFRTVSVLLTILYLNNSLSDAQTNGSTIPEPYDLLFDNAVEAYYKGDWMTVILNMERALKNKGLVRKIKAQCRLACANQTAFLEGIPGIGPAIPGAGSIEDLGFFQSILKRADCITSCESEKLGPYTLHDVSDETLLEFRKRTPYNYLQVAYFKIKKLDRAVSAAHTFFLANPDHMEMKQNLDYYKLMAGVQESDFKDLEAPPHMVAFLDGKKLYSSDNFAGAVSYLEKAVEEFFPAYEECRALCEGSYDYDGYNYMEYKADLFQAMTDHFLQVLNCKQNCVLELATTSGKDKPFEDFLPSLFNYLQFTYFNSENYEKAVECAKTYLLFHPEDEVMKQNLAYYTVVVGEENAAAIHEREVIKQYIKKSLLEKELLYFGYEIFGVTFVDPDPWTPAEVMPVKLREKQKNDRETAARITEEIGNLMKEIETLVVEKNKDSSDLTKIVSDVPQADSQPVAPPAESVLFDSVKVTMTANMLNGTDRVQLDGVITDDECRELHRLSNAAAKTGDGYGKPSPHSPSEMFQGVTVLKALQLGQDGTVPLKSARVFFDLSEKVRKILESYFHLPTTLYFSYSHLVCRTAIEEKQEDRNDLSHAVHADNCLLISELNECVKEPPAYTHRDYSAILYLNDDFEGGDFIFTEMDGKTVTATVRPTCGRVVGFGAGKENPHGVKAVTKGQRCAVALWFTLDPRHEEKERIQAQELLNMLSSPVDAEFQGTPEDKSADTPTQADDSRPVAQPDGSEVAQVSKEEEQTTAQVAQQAEKQTDTPETPVSAQNDASPEVKSTGDAVPEVKSTGDAAPEVKSTGDAAPEVKSTGDAAPEVKSTGDAAPEVKSTGDAAPEVKSTGDTAKDNKESKTDEKPKPKTAVKTKPKQTDKTHAKQADKSKPKQADKTKPRQADKTKPKQADKSKPKQADKTKPKQVDKKESTSTKKAAKKAPDSKKAQMKTTDSKAHKEEL
ncbi:prolyl 3-hydroxylase 1 [Alosa pseudoharengus]|uniref:prolyl 3-hydroxylase 1 n=1 Tax=Alosa pseudoharengus TaxID=34774 RepID=UPI003F8AC29F